MFKIMKGIINRYIIITFNKWLKPCQRVVRSRPNNIQPSLVEAAPSLRETRRLQSMWETLTQR